MIANVFNASDFDTQFNLSLTAALNQIQVKPSNNQDAVNNSIQNHQEQTSSSALMPLNFYKFESSLTITDFVKSFNESKEANLLNGVSCSSNESMDSFITDLVGSNLTFNIFQIKYYYLGFRQLVFNQISLKLAVSIELSVLIKLIV